MKTISWIQTFIDIDEETELKKKKSKKAKKKYREMFVLYESKAKQKCMNAVRISRFSSI